MKIKILFTITCLCLTLISEINAQSSKTKSVRVLFDQAHGETALQGEFKNLMDVVANKVGLDLLTSTNPIDADMLKSVNILYLRAPSTQISISETEAIVSFVKKGGALFLVLDEERRQSLEKTGVNNILSPFGMKLTSDTPYLHNCGAIAKAGVINKGDLELPYSGGRAVEGGTPFAYRLDKDSKSAEAFAAYKKIDKGGRIVVLGEGMSSLFLGEINAERLSDDRTSTAGTKYWGKDSVAFMEEIFAWLSN